MLVKSMIAFICFFCVFGLLNAQKKSTGSSLLPVDSQLRYGILDNGFTYYVKEGKPASGLVSINFVVKSGFLQEDEKQKELSHVLEHVAFRGTTNFPKGLYYYLEKLGVQRGNQINGSTGYNSTNYFVDVPSDSSKNVDLGLRLIRDLATEILFRQEDIENERAAVISERLKASGKVMRELDGVIPKLLGRSDYSKVGFGSHSVENVKKFEHSDLIRFYKDWYRPDLESVIVVGDVNSDSVVKQIRRLFSTIPPCKPCMPYKHHAIYVPGRSSYLKFTEFEQTDFVVKMYKIYPADSLRTVNDLRNSTMAKLYNILFLNRIKELSTRSAEPFQSAVHLYSERGLSGLVGINTLMTAFRVDSLSKLKPQLIAFMRELRRVEQHGFTDQEFVIAKTDLSKQIARQQSTGTSDLVSACMDNFLYGYPLLDQESEFKLTSSLLEELQLKDFNLFAKHLLADENWNVFLWAPNGMQADLPSRRSFSGYLKEAGEGELSSYKPIVRKDYIPLSPPAGDTSKIVSRVESVGVTEVKLGNGIKIILKPFVPSAEMDDDGLILVHGFAAGGASLFPDSDYFSAISSAKVMGQSGIGDLTDVELNENLNRKGIRVSPYINDFGSGIKGSSDSIDFEMLMSIIYQYFSSPVLNRKSFDNWLKNEFESISRTEAYGVLWDTVSRFTREENLNLDYESIKLVDFRRSGEIFSELFNKNANNYTFVITGNFHEREILSILTKYLSPLHGNPSEVTASKLGNKNFLRAVHSKTLYGETEAASVELRISKQFTFCGDNVWKLEALSWFLDRQLNIKLRERLSGVYFVSTHVKFFKYPIERYVFNISFKCASEKVDTLIKAVMEEIVDIQRVGISDQLYNNYFTSLQFKLSQSVKRNSFWSQYLYFSYFNRINLSLGYKIESRKFNIEEIPSFASLFLDVDDFMYFVMMPKDAVKANSN